MAGKILFAMFIAGGIAYAQEAAPKAGGDSPRVEVQVKAAPAKKCSIPLINVRPQYNSRIPMIRPRNDFAPKRFFIDPPAPPCEDENQLPVTSNAAPEKKEDPPAK